MAKKDYRRLTRTRGQLTGYCSLWLGPDHVLSVFSTGWSEKYKRFYLRDIQAVVVRETERWRIWSVVLIGLALLFAAIAATVPVGAGTWVFGILAFLFLLGLVLNLLAGPSCQCHIRTAVQLEPLPSLSRVKRVAKFLARIEPLVAEAQGRIAPEEIPARSEEFSRAAPATPGPAAPLRAPDDDPNAPPVIQPGS